MLRNQELISEFNRLIARIDLGLIQMNEEIISRATAGIEVLIVNTYGKQSAHYKKFNEIGKWNNVLNLRKNRGILLAIRDDIQNTPFFPSVSLNSNTHSENTPVMKELSYILLQLFSQNSHYNYEAIRNLILNNSDYFDYNEDDAAYVFKKFIDRGIIASIGIGYAYAITEEGKKLYLRLSSQRNTFSNPANTEGVNKHDFDVFLCHSSKDKQLINLIIDDFKGRGITYWVDSEQIDPGENIIDKITDGLEKSRIIVPFISANQLASGWCRSEYQAILAKVISNNTTQRIAPLLLDETSVDQIPLLLRNYRCERYDINDEYKRFLNFLEK
jgi:hypothetical protein